MWHPIPSTDVVAALESTEKGLSSEEARTRQQKFGANRLPAAPTQNPLIRFLQHFHNILIYVLIGAAAITASLGHMADTIVILAVVFANAVIGYVQEGKAEKAMDAIRGMLAPKASVIRDGIRRSVDGEALVPGDIVVLEAGDKVPADLRLIQTTGLQIQEAILTGESVPVDKENRPVPADAPLGDRRCMAFSGTLVTSGLGRGVVVATGADTEIGRISGMLSRVEVLATPLTRQMNLFGRRLTVVILFVSALLLVFGYSIAHFPFADIFMAVVGLSVAAIPEGLPAVLTITLAVGVQAMASRNAIVRRLPAIETLGSVSVICTDKTGTLTRNEMSVASVITEAHTFSPDGSGYAPSGEIRLDDVPISPREYLILRELGHAAALCNDAELHEREGVWLVEGDPMEGALLALSGRIGIDTRRDLAGWTRTDAIPFDARHRFMATLHHDHEDHAFVFVKGAPERIFSMCDRQRTADNDTASFDASAWHSHAETVAARGERVLAFAAKPVSSEQTVLKFSDAEHGLILIGLVGLIDPPRPEAINAITECHEAGIRVKMITGDHKGTAAAIAKSIGLQNPGRVLTGPDLDGMDDSRMAHVVLDTDVFARTSPEHKLRLVEALQSHGLSVAMTGDGINDTPALKRADVGIAMGRNGSEAAREAAEFVLADDNFASIAAAVREGRTVYSNIKKVISWTLPTNAGEAMTIIVALLFGMTLPITPIQILWINLITAITLGIALAFEPTESDTMRRPPRPRTEPLLSGELAWHIILVSTLFVAGVFGVYSYAIHQDYSVDLARTIALNTLVVMEIFHLFFIRNLHGTSLLWKTVRATNVVWITVGAVIAAQISITFLPPLQALFSTTTIPFADIMIIVAIGFALFAIIETEKRVRLRLKRASG
ncbi:MAG TPA: cation-transporting P-type ATPase [Alphaproteobacteria bacterium]|nr:cation-transporting P-type ATPase [Alphaproteobacteria bacterium]